MVKLMTIIVFLAVIVAAVATKPDHGNKQHHPQQHTHGKQVVGHGKSSSAGHGHSQSHSQPGVHGHDSSHKTHGSNHGQQHVKSQHNQKKHGH
ncbi:zinc transporter 7-like [Malaya genurostris]|uniref:zinc transporter 7-like n=1 Tax=Malaya genurostris TaxID=325434 RepID=UPI0026F3E9A8|nr:zinc transporter 7-like [Malaya genurostris]